MKIRYNGDYINVDYLVKYDDYLEYVPKYEWIDNCKWYYLVPKKSIYDKLKEGDYIGVITDTGDKWNERIIWFSTIEKKYKNGKVLVYEA